MTHGTSRRDLVHRTREIWENNAAFWDERIGDGDDLHTRLIAPAVEGLLSPKAGERVLDVACGNGAFARHLSAGGVHVVACDFAEAFIRRARARQASGPEIDYRVIDATVEGQLLSLGQDAFDAVVCNMALTDMVAIEPLFWAIPQLLKREGRFVFTISHPCFNHAGSRLIAEEDLTGEQRTVHHALRLDNYLDVAPGRDVSMDDQPESHFSFHRPLSDILNAAFNAGLVMDGITEPAFPRTSSSRSVLEWTNVPLIPPVLAARFRPGGSRR
jgi:SAM-dependent methyltransferase